MSNTAVKTDEPKFISIGIDGIRSIFIDGEEVFNLDYKEEKA